MAQLVGSEELTGELAGTDDDDLHGKAEGKENREYSEAPACCPASALGHYRWPLSKTTIR